MATLIRPSYHLAFHLTDQTAGMTDADAAIDRFLQKADDAYGEYEAGYADADATLRRLERHVNNPDHKGRGFFVVPSDYR